MIRISRYRFTFCAQDPIGFPPFPGSAIRGLFGHGLKRSVCVTRLHDCSKCNLRSHCVYSYLFETQVMVEKGKKMLHPLILDVHRLARWYETKEKFNVEATLIGNANRNFPYLIQAWQRAGRQGLGRENARFELLQADILDFQSREWWKLFPVESGTIELPEPFDLQSIGGATPEQVQVRLMTPYRGKRNGHLVTPKSFCIQGFMVSLVSRIATLKALHDPDSGEIDLGSQMHAASRLTMTDTNLRWKEWTRHSSRQRTHMKMGGVVGSFTISGEGLRLLWPALQLGQWIQAGKNTMFGLGHYRIENPIQTKRSAE